MNIYKYCFLVVAVTSCTSFTTASAASRTHSISPQLSTFVAGEWVRSDHFFKKNTYCYREYTCKPLTPPRFGRNLKIESTKLKLRKTYCAGPIKTCQCNTAPPEQDCKIRLLIRR